MTGSRGAGVAALVGVLLFWAGVFGAGALVTGYSAREDYISSLAGRGSPVAALGVAALLSSAVAHVATAIAVLSAWRSRLCTSFLLAAAGATLVVAAFGQSCPDGPAGCALQGDHHGDWVDAVHGAGVGLYQLFILGAMLTLAVGALRRTPAWPRWLGVVSGLFAAGSVLLVANLSGDDVGLWQRLWLADNLAWLLLVAWAATVRASGTTPEEVPPGQGGTSDRITDQRWRHR